MAGDYNGYGANEQQEEDALKVIAGKMDQIRALLAECEQIAQENGVSFSSPIGEYGMGGYFDPNDGWISSSSGC